MNRLIALLIAATATAATGCATPDDMAAWPVDEQAHALEGAEAQASAADDERLADPDGDGGEVQASVAYTDWLSLDGDTHVTVCYNGDCGGLDPWTGGGGDPPPGNGGGGGGSSGDGDGGDDGGGSSGDDPYRGVPKVSPPPYNHGVVIEDSSHIRECFELDDNDGMSHTVTVYVRQSTPGSSDRFNVATQSFGHVWIGIEQTAGGGPDPRRIGGVTRRMIGMHPNSQVIAHGVRQRSLAHIRDEPAQHYDVALTLPVSPEHFRALMANFAHGDGTTHVVTGTYDIETHNSVDFVHDLIIEAGYLLPKHEPTSGRFRGPDPSRFGYDLLNNFTVHPNMQRTENGWAPASDVNCPELQQVPEGAAF